VCAYEDVRVTWNQEISTDREVTENGPDITIKKKRQKMRILIDVAVPVDRNVTQKEQKIN
jgi:hypothetical protein